MMQTIERKISILAVLVLLNIITMRADEILDDFYWGDYTTQAVCIDDDKTPFIKEFSTFVIDAINNITNEGLRNCNDAYMETQHFYINVCEHPIMNTDSTIVFLIEVVPYPLYYFKNPKKIFYYYPFNDKYDFLFGFESQLYSRLEIKSKGSIKLYKYKGDLYDEPPCYLNVMYNFNTEKFEILKEIIW